MKPTRATTLNSPKNEIGKNNYVKQQIKGTNVYSPRGDRNKIHHLGMNKCSNPKLEKYGEEELKKISSPESKIDSEISHQTQPPQCSIKSNQKKVPQKINKQLEKKQTLPKSPRNFNPASNRNFQGKGSNIGIHESSAVINLKQQETAFLNKIKDLEEKIQNYEHQMSQKQKLISNLISENGQLQKKNSKINEVMKENKKMLREKVMKFNQQSDQIRKLKQRIQELQAEVRMYKQKEEKEDQTLSHSYDAQLQKEESQLRENWTPPVQLTDSYMLKMLQSKIGSGYDKSLNHSESTERSRKQLCEGDSKLSNLISNQEQKIKQQNKIIKSLEEKLEVEEMKMLQSENLQLKNKLGSSFHNTKSERKKKLPQKHKEIILSIDKMLSISRKNSKIMLGMLAK